MIRNEIIIQDDRKSQQTTRFFVDSPDFYQGKSEDERKKIIMLRLLQCNNLDILYSFRDLNESELSFNVVDDLGNPLISFKAHLNDRTKTIVLSNINGFKAHPKAIRGKIERAFDGNWIKWNYSYFEKDGLI